jgi:Flp pilus assembly pilin Flp
MTAMTLPRSVRGYARTGATAAFAFRRDESGVTAVSFAILSTVALGFGGLAIDLGTAYQSRQNLQNAADSAAFSAATALVSGESTATDQAAAIAARYGLVHGSGGTVVAINRPPASGPFAGALMSVEVILRKPAKRFLSGLFVSADSLIQARAVSRVNPGVDGCVVGLSGRVVISSATVSLMACSLYSNAAGANAFEMSGTASFQGSAVSVVGGTTIGSNSTITATNGIRTQQQPITDPYSDVPVPPYSGCTYNSGTLASGTYGGSYSSPVVFCNGLLLNSGVTVRFNPGIYIIDRGEFRINGGATLTGTGVTIILTSSTGSNYAVLNINGQSSVSLSSPATGPTAGLVFYQDRRAPAGVENVLNGGTGQALQGAIYFPRQIVRFTGGSSSTTGACTQLIAAEVILRGQSNFQMNCSGTGVRRTGSAAVALVE